MLAVIGKALLGLVLNTKNLASLSSIRGPPRTTSPQGKREEVIKLEKWADVVYEWPLKYVLYSVIIVYMLCNISRFLRQQIYT